MGRKENASTLEKVSKEEDLGAFQIPLSQIGSPYAWQYLKANRELAFRWGWKGELAACYLWGSRMSPKG